MSLGDFEHMRLSATLLRVATFIMGVAMFQHSSLHVVFKILFFSAALPLLVVLLSAESDRIEEDKRGL